MAKITGIGGIFLKCRDVEVTRNWYAQHFGISLEEWGAMFKWSENNSSGNAYSLISFNKETTNYFDPSKESFMINFRVDNLDEIVANLRAARIELIGDPIAEDYGKFAWVMDPDGRKIELWEQ